MRTFFSTLGALLVLGLALPMAGCAPSDELIMSEAGDPAIVAATAEARRTLPIFWSKFDAKAPDHGEFALKVGFEAKGGGVEHLWVKPTKRDGATLTGALANTAYYLEGLKAGMAVEFGEDEISDWQYAKGGKLYGHFTTRALMERGSEAQRKEALALFAPTALEAGAN